MPIVIISCGTCDYRTHNKVRDSDIATYVVQVNFLQSGSTRIAQNKVASRIPLLGATINSEPAIPCIYQTFSMNVFNKIQDLKSFCEKKWRGKSGMAQTVENRVTTTPCNAAAAKKQTMTKSTVPSTGDFSDVRVDVNLSSQNMDNRLLTINSVYS